MKKKKQTKKPNLYQAIDSNQTSFLQPVGKKRQKKLAKKI